MFVCFGGSCTVVHRENKSKLSKTEIILFSNCIIDKALVHVTWLYAICIFLCSFEFLLIHIHNDLSYICKRLYIAFLIRFRKVHKTSLPFPLSLPLDSLVHRLPLHICRCFIMLIIATECNLPDHTKVTTHSILFITNSC